MKKPFILAGLLSFFLFQAKAQQKDSLLKENLKKTDIEMVYNHYIQDGHNSAVTGGIGTEKLTVYAPGFIYKRSYKNRGLILKGGSDIISSASTDKIDFVKSSASILDARTYANLTISKSFSAKRLELGIGSGFSIESDYFSLPLQFTAIKSSKDKMRTAGIDLQLFFDDLRWGRLNSDYYSPQYLIYPVELRYKDWFTTKKRQSYNVKTSLTQKVNKRNVVGVYPEFSFQSGLLSTPFHRVYFRDSGEAVEKFPDQRFKVGIGLKHNVFMGGRTILKNSLDVYSDNFGIRSLGLENETAYKMSEGITISAFLRLYAQTAANFFRPYMEHESNAQYYSSDYDLSRLSSYKAGVSIKKNPGKSIGRHSYFNGFVLRYAFYKRSNGLQAHIISFTMGLSHQKKK